MENEREDRSALLDIVKNMIIPGRLSGEMIEYGKNNPERMKEMSQCEKVFFHTASYVLPWSIWAGAIYKVFE